ncbi:hypothetical protein [Roseovarius sp. 2305UL8-3]|uniref:hypothetical protein n=1 Tax=Roseovarius conchicola TaxID=3121636 RepID=UPI003528742C
MRRIKALLLPMLVAANPGLAANEIPVPEGCTPVVTVMKNSCFATTLFDCGASKEAHSYTDGKLQIIHDYNADWELKEFRLISMNDARMTAVPGTGANMKIKELLEIGSVEENGDFLFNTGVIEDRKYNLDGRVELSDNIVTLSDVPFRKGRIYRTFELEPGAGGLDFEMDLYVSSDPDLVIEASWQRSIKGNNVEAFDLTPQSLIWPGEAGFLTDRSEFGCE